MLFYLLDLCGIFLMGDGLAKILSPTAHNRIYQAPFFPPAYNRALGQMAFSRKQSIWVGLVMVLLGGVLSAFSERYLFQKAHSLNEKER